MASVLASAACALDIPTNETLYSLPKEAYEVVMYTADCNIT